MILIRRAGRGEGPEGAAPWVPGSRSAGSEVARRLGSPRGWHPRSPPDAGRVWTGFNPFAQAISMDTQTLIDAFEHLDTWEERYELISELSRELLPLTESDRIDANLIKGCDTRTWLTGQMVPGTESRLEYRAAAEGPLVQGLVAVLLLPFQGKSPEDVLATDPYPFIRRLGLDSALSAKRQAGMQAFIERVKVIAARYCAAE